VDVLSGEAIRRGQDDHIERGERRLVAQSVEARTGQAGPAIAVVAKHMGRIKRPTLLADVFPQSGHLVRDGLGQRLAARRDPGGKCGAHHRPPVGLRSSPTAAGADTRGPSVAPRRSAVSAAELPAIPAASAPPGWAFPSSRGVPCRKRSGRRHQLRVSRVARTKQILPVVIKKSLHSPGSGLGFGVSAHLHAAVQ